MQFAISLKLLENKTNTSYISVSPDIDDITCWLDLYVSPDLKFEDVVSIQNILKMFRIELNNIKDDEEFANTVETLQKLINTEFNILENCIFITIDSTPEIATYIEQSQFLKSTELYLEGEYSINHEDLDEIDQIFGKYENIYVRINGNDESVSISDYKKTVNAIDKIVDKIRKYDLSPLEQIMYAYDLVRDRVYTKEDDTEETTVSRDLTSVLLGDKIVCVGYANIFEKVLSNIGIKSLMYSIKNVDKTKNGHRRNIVYIKDEKYNVNGIYYFDTTWDSKKDPNDKSFLNSYKFFGKLKEDIESYSKMFTDRTFEGFHEAMVWEFEEILDEKGLKAVPRQMIHTINEISEFVDDYELINTMLLIDNPIIQIPDFIKNSFDRDKIMDKLCEYRRLFFDEEISTETLLQVLYNVRKIEYYEDPDKYPFNIDTFREAIINSDWIIETNSTANSILGTTRLMSKNASEQIISEYLNDFSQKTDLERNINHVKLAKVLRLILEKRKQSK